MSLPRVGNLRSLTKVHQDGAALCQLFLDQLAALGIKGPNILEVSLLKEQGRMLTPAEQYEDAVNCYSEAFKKLGEVNKEGEYDMLQLGGLALMTERYSEALKQFNQGSQVYKSSPNPSIGWKGMQVRFLIGLAFCRINMQDEGNPTASEYFKQARDLAKSFNDKESIADIDALSYLIDKENEKIH
jgi:tetratricopeptide (TPR) repeat protein